MDQEPGDPHRQGEIVYRGAAPPSGSEFDLHSARRRCPPHGNWRMVEDVTHPIHRAVCQIEILVNREGGGTDLYCGTGFLVAPRLVITAAHNLISRNACFDLFFGRTPSGYVARARSGDAEPHPDYNGHDALHDLAAIALPDDSVWRIIGKSIACVSATKAELRTAPLMVAGYPIEGLPLEKAGPGTQWANAGYAEGAIAPRKIFYAIDTEDGMSGSPVLSLDATAPAAVGVHIQGDCPNNRGKLFEPDDIRWIKGWIANGLG